MKRLPMITPITKLDMLRYRASHQAKRVSEARAAIKAAEQIVGEAKQASSQQQDQL